MDKFIVSYTQKLEGQVFVSGAKNSALKILAASLLVDGITTIENVPDLMDIRTMIRVLVTLGAKVEHDKDKKTVTVDATEITCLVAPYELVRTMRASFQVMGPLLSRFGEAEVSLPGGCSIGPRPVDIHVKAFRDMGAEVFNEKGYVKAKAKKLKPATIYLEFPSVGATENAMMAASLIQGITTIENAAREPEVQDLADFLRMCGVGIHGDGTSTIEIHGIPKLKSSVFRVMPDRIEAGTLILAGCMTRSEIDVLGAPVHALDSVLKKLRECGNHFVFHDQGIRVYPALKPVGVDVSTRPYPGFPTDLQAPMMAYLSTVEGVSSISEGIYENRFVHIPELNRMGAQIHLEGSQALIRGVSYLEGAPVMASDLRAGAALVLASLRAKGQTEISRIYHVDRGYEKLEQKLCSLGAKISRASV